MTSNENISEQLFEESDKKMIFESDDKKSNETSKVNKESAFPLISNDNITKENKNEEQSVVPEDKIIINTDSNESSVVGDEAELPEFHYVEPKNPFAKDLPEWTLEPPMGKLQSKSKK